MDTMSIRMLRTPCAYARPTASCRVHTNPPGWGLGRRWEKDGLAVLFHEVEHAVPRVVAGVLPLLVGAVEKAVGCSFVDVRLIRHPGRLQRLLELLVLLGRRGPVRAGDQDQQGRFHLGDERLAARRPAVEADAP